MIILSFLGTKQNRKEKVTTERRLNNTIALSLMDALILLYVRMYIHTYTCINVSTRNNYMHTYIMAVNMFE